MATPTPNFFTPGEFNTHVPGATAKVQVEFSRAMDRFPLMRYLRVVPVDKNQDLYPEHSTDDIMRLVTENDHLWPDGQERPRQEARSFRWKNYLTERRTFGFTMGKKSVDVADFDLVAAQARGAAHKAMTSRANHTWDVLATSGNWPTGNVSATVDALLGTSGEDWFASSTTENTIENSILAVSEAVAKTSGGVVNAEELMLVINPTTARKMSTTAEIQAYKVSHAGTNDNFGRRIFINQYGLPSYLFGVTLVVDNTPKVTTRRNTAGTATRSFVVPDDTAVFVSRPEGLEGNNAPSFATVSMFALEEMNVEAKTDDWHRIVEGGVTEDKDIRLTAPTSGYLISDVST